MISFRFNNEIQRLFVNILFSSYTVMHNGYLYAKGRKSNIKKKGKTFHISALVLLLLKN